MCTESLCPEGIGDWVSMIGADSGIGVRPVREQEQSVTEIVFTLN
jgi:hypothetical protein